MSRQRVPEGPPPAPVVQRLRVQYAKRGRMRFCSVRDVQRSLERALRRTGTPVAFSAGFHPHPRISYANAAPTSVASDAEYFEIGLAQHLEPETFRASVDAALPAGLDLVRAVEASAGSLHEKLQASSWEVRFSGVAVSAVAEAVAVLLEREEVLVTRMVKAGRRTLDVRAALLEARADVGQSGPEEPGCAIMHMVVRHNTPAVRPDDVLAALRTVAGLEPPTPPLVTRLAQGPLFEATAEVADPLAVDESTAGTASGAARLRDPGVV